MDIQIIGLMVVAAFVIMRLFDAIVKPLWEKAGLDKFWLLYLALVVGAALGWYTELNGFPVFKDPLVGRILSCLAMGLGPSWLHDLTDKKPSD